MKSKKCKYDLLAWYRIRSIVFDSLITAVIFILVFDIVNMYVLPLIKKIL